MVFRFFIHGDAADMVSAKAWNYHISHRYRDSRIAVTRKV